MVECSTTMVCEIEVVACVKYESNQRWANIRLRGREKARG